MSPFRVVLLLIRGLFLDRVELAAENLALRQQLAVLEHKSKRPRLRKRDRIFWSVLSWIWPNWRTALLIVQPETVVRWHQQSFKLYWRWKSRSGKPGRPKIGVEIRKLIRRMSLENPLWGTRRIQSELLLLGHEASKATVDKYRARRHKPPSQTWRAFLDNHVPDIVAVDFFTVPTATFRILFCFVVLHHHRRMVVHFNVTANTTAKWAAQQMIEAFPEDHASRFLIRDRDSIYGEFFRQRIKHMGIEEVVTAPRSPWQNAYAERFVRTNKEGCLNQMISFSERSLHRAVKEFATYYHHERNHQGIGNRLIDPLTKVGSVNGTVECREHLGGLLRYYYRNAA